MKRSHGIGFTLVGLLALMALLSVFVVRADFGVNWTATVFNNPNLQGTPVATINNVNGINFIWGTNPPNINGAIPGVGADNFSIRFSSTQAIIPGTYNFIVTSDDGVRVFIDGQLVLDRFVGRPLTTDTFTRTITNPTTQITVEYFEGIDQASITFQWFIQGGVGTPGTLVPTVTTAPTAVPLTASVVNVRGLAVRTGPYLGASLVTVARPGTAYVPTARNSDEGGPYTWYLLTVGERTGWASGRYLEFTGDPNALPVQGTIFDQIDGAPNVGVSASPRSVMNFRRRPSIRSAVLGLIPWGAPLELIGRTVQGGENFWFHVRYEGQVGWIYAPFVSVRGNINAVPIR